MKIIEITASFGCTKQLQQYEPINVHCAVKAEIPEGGDVDKATKECYAVARKQVKDQISDIQMKKADTIPGREKASEIAKKYGK